MRSGIVCFGLLVPLVLAHSRVNALNMLEILKIIMTLNNHPKIFSPSASQTSSLAKTLMVQGTASHVGKSLVTTALCRILKRRGFKVAPFKAQNMANNSFVTSRGGEIGRAQAVQALACGIEPQEEMNPLLLKPNSDHTSQIVLMGKPIATLSAMEYQERKSQFASQVFQALDDLRRQYDLVVIEGAGSPAEINMKEQDIVNMRVARTIQAPVVLVADIDKGGVFAQLVGTFELLDPQERDLVKTFIINKFRGDPQILQPGVTWLQERLNRKSLGVLPMIKDLDIEEEDSVALDDESLLANCLTPDVSGTDRRQNQKLLVHIIRLPRISNFTDFQSLAKEPDVVIQYLERPLRHILPDLLIIPGTKSTIDDLEFLKQSAFAQHIRRCLSCGVDVLGICGGYQMMGQKIEDPDHVESSVSSAEGLGLLPVTTVFHSTKTTVQVRAIHMESGQALAGYEIHMGQTRMLRGAQAQPLFKIVERQGQAMEAYDGCRMSVRHGDGLTSGIYGTYVHSLFDAAGFRRYFINVLRAKAALSPVPRQGACSSLDVPCSFDRLADEFEKHLDLTLLGEILGERL
jgi:adenosylcobyric acid synthase